ncbi:MAG: hypothetical protein L0H31_17370 [Nocardioidaceae bacterium]|nr:hypothetical protein [Nocardioidaceae bacterium]
MRYMFFSFGKAWGSDPEGFLYGEFLQAGDPGISAEVVVGVLVPLVLVWIAVLVIMALGVQNGIGTLSLYFIPVLLVAVVSMLVVAWVVQMLPTLAEHLNRFGSLRVGPTWYVLVSFLAPALLVYVLGNALSDDIQTAYEGYPGWLLGVFGWGSAGAVIVFSALATMVRWRPDTALTEPYDRTEGIR